MWATVHPILGAVTVALVAWLAVVGLRARHRARYAPRARRLHRRAGGAVFVLFVATALLGLGSTLWLRDDLSPAASAHFAAAVVGLAAMTALALLGRRLPADRAAARIHPWIGYVALGSAAALLVLGFGLLP